MTIVTKQRHRIGLLVPSSNTTMETEFWKALPSDVSVHSARMRIVNTTAEELAQMDQDLESAVELLATADLDVICYGCTTGSLRLGIDHDHSIAGRIEQISGVPAVTTATAVVRLLKEKAVSKLAVATPYVQELNQAEREYLTAHGFEVQAMRGLEIRPNLEIGRQVPETAYLLGQTVMRQAPEAQALFISCTNFPTWGILGRLAGELNKPVVCSNQATLWMALQQCRLSNVDWGVGW